MKCHNKDMQVKFHNSVLHFNQVMPLLSLQIYTLDNTSCPLYKSYTNWRIFFKLDWNVYLNNGMCRTNVAYVSAERQCLNWMSNKKQLNMRHFVVPAL